MGKSITELAAEKLVTDARDSYIKSDENVTWFLNEQHHYRDSRESMLKEAFEKGAASGIEIAERLRQEIQKEGVCKIPTIAQQIATKEILGSKYSYGQLFIVIDHGTKGINQNQYFALLELGWEADGHNKFVYKGK